MIVEHAFVTTLDGPVALKAIRDLLASRGWRITEGDASLVEAAAGDKVPAKARSVNRLPQNLRAEFDRGRVSLAASMQTRYAPKPVHSQYLIAIVQAVEHFVVSADPNCCVEWDSLIAHHEQQYRRRRRNSLIFLIALFAFAFAVVFFAIFASSR